MLEGGARLGGVHPDVLVDGHAFSGGHADVGHGHGQTLSGVHVDVGQIRLLVSAAWVGHDVQIAIFRLAVAVGGEGGWSGGGVFESQLYMHRLARCILI